MDYIRLQKNKDGWDRIADDWFGSTALPIYGPHMPTESDLGLLENIGGKKVLDIGCGSGHSLEYMGDHKASELWGLDLSTSQIEHARKHLTACGYEAKLFNAPMETNPGIPENYFDIVYSIYALGWTVDLDKTLALIASYLKPGGIFVMSWDHPMMGCLDMKGETIIIDQSYHELKVLDMGKKDASMQFTKWKMSSYVNGLTKAGLYMEHLVEDIQKEVKEGSYQDYQRYYSMYKAQHLPLSMIIKARKMPT